MGFKFLGFWAFGLLGSGKVELAGKVVAVQGKHGRTSDSGFAAVRR